MISLIIVLLLVGLLLWAWFGYTPPKKSEIEIWLDEHVKTCEKCYYFFRVQDIAKDPRVEVCQEAEERLKVLTK